MFGHDPQPETDIADHACILLAPDESGFFDTIQRGEHKARKITRVRILHKLAAGSAFL